MSVSVQQSNVLCFVYLICFYHARVDLYLRFTSEER